MFNIGDILEVIDHPHGPFMYLFDSDDVCIVCEEPVAPLPLSTMSAVGRAGGQYDFDYISNYEVRLYLPNSQDGM